MLCRTCNSEKLAEAFYASSSSRCKECVRAKVAAHRLENIERIRAYDRMRASQPHRMAKNFKNSQAWRQEFPSRRRAQGMVQHALRSGKMKKQPCWVCGESAIANHPDYDSPLDVVWLCQQHHKQAHALVANEPQLREAA